VVRHPFASAIFRASTLALLMLPLACDSSPSSPTSTGPFTITDIRVGTGAEATNGRFLLVTYTGWLYDTSRPDGKGREFDSNVGEAAFGFRLGSGLVIAGWEQGVVGMRAGGLRRLIIPPALAYGDERNDDIPANATLVFDIELLSVQ
jgi:FKBP-type peptidyl-prolyl cis-trans isomerase FkpA